MEICLKGRESFRHASSLITGPIPKARRAGRQAGNTRNPIVHKLQSSQAASCHIGGKSTGAERGGGGALHLVSSTYVEKRAVSGIFQYIDPPPPLQPASVSSPCTKGGGGGGGGTHSPGGDGVGSQYFGRRYTLDWPLTIQYNPSTVARL
jgi:hypothetical protein